MRQWLVCGRGYQRAGEGFGVGRKHKFSADAAPGSSRRFNASHSPIAKSDFDRIQNVSVSQRNIHGQMLVLVLHRGLTVRIGARLRHYSRPTDMDIVQYNCFMRIRTCLKRSSSI